MRGRVARCLGLAAVIAAGAGAASCTSDRQAASSPDADVSAPPASRPPIESIGMIGDSITVGAEQALRESFAELGLFVAGIDAENGRRMTVPGAPGSGVEAAGRVAAQEPDLWTVALGTNDVGVYAGAEEYRAAIGELIAAIPDEAPLVWVDVYVDSTVQANVEFNATLTAALSERGNATVVRWADVADDEGILADGVHPSAEGVAVFADLVAAAVAEWMDGA